MGELAGVDVDSRLWWGASIAYVGVRKSVRAQREATRKQQWWERARWALDLTLSDDSTSRSIGLEVLDALGL